MNQSNKKKYALITGGATRIGAAMCQVLHNDGYTIFLHYGQSQGKAQTIQSQFNQLRSHSCFIFSQDLSESNAVENITSWFTNTSQELNNDGEAITLDLLINNASVFYPTPWGEANTNHWQQTMTINAQLPLFLSQALLPYLKNTNGSSIVNMIDVHAERSLEDHPVYSASKAALKSITQSFAKDLGDTVRCNGISPGAILWPDQSNAVSEDDKNSILNKVPMGRLGNVENICQALMFLAQNDYINGQIINVDGGRTVFS